MNRIDAINSFILDSDKVVDVGCDQAKLGILLAKRGISSIASDVSKNVIELAKNNIKEYSSFIDLRISDGLSNIKEGEANTLVLAGMGTYTILDIIRKSNLRFDKIITISNNYHDILRNSMNELNYKIKNELIIKENNKYYNLILFVPGNNELSDKELFLGINHLDNKLYREYLEFLLNKYSIISSQSNNVNEKINKRIKYINEELLK